MDCRQDYLGYKRSDATTTQSAQDPFGVRHPAALYADRIDRSANPTAAMLTTESEREESATSRSPSWCGFTARRAMPLRSPSG